MYSDAWAHLGFDLKVRQVAQSGKLVLRKQEKRGGEHEAEQRAADRAANAGEKLEARHQKRSEHREPDDTHSQNDISLLFRRDYTDLLESRNYHNFKFVNI